MYKIEITHQYLKDVKLARKRQLDENKLNQIIQLLAIGQALPLKNKDHALTGTFSGVSYSTRLVTHLCHQSSNTNRAINTNRISLGFILKHLKFS